VFWFDGYSVYHINYFLTQAGQDPIVNAEKIDGPLRNGETPEQWFNRMRESTLARAGGVVVNDEPERYANPAADPGLSRNGQAFVEDVINSHRLDVVSRFKVGPNKFAILNNRRID